MAQRTLHHAGRSFFSRGEGTLAIPYSMHRDHRVRLLARYTRVRSSGCLFFRGGEERNVYDQDTTWDYKQESNFQWLFGCKEPGLHGAIDIASGDAYLFIPRLPDSYAQWMGPIKPTAWFKNTYEVEHVLYEDEMESALEGVGAPLIVSKGMNLDSGSREHDNLTHDGVKASTKLSIAHCTQLYHALAEERLIKDAEELKIMQFTNDVSSQAHIITMRAAQREDRRKEYQSEAEFKYQSFLRGCSRVGYSCICPAGERNATLHYGHAGEPNEHGVNDGDLKLHDMGAEYHGYTADVTCTFPVGGKFSPEQKAVYDAVWAAVVAVESAIRPGVSYIDLHILAQRVMIEEMIKDGLFVNGGVDEMMAANLMSIFMPHGLGHQLGLDVHDVGGYVPGTDKSLLAGVTPHPVTQNLRFARDCEENMVFTVEPGFYFNAWLLEKLKADPKLMKFVSSKRLAQLAPVGGVRIEDNIVVTANGCRVLSNVPRTTADIEAVIAGREWDGACRVYSNTEGASLKRGAGAADGIAANGGKRAKH